MKLKIKGYKPTDRAKMREMLKNVSYELFLRGFSLNEVRQEINERFYNPDGDRNSVKFLKKEVSQNVVRVYITEMLEEAKTQMFSDTEFYVFAELDRISRLEQEYWEAWEKSKTDFTQDRTKVSGDVKNGKSEGSKKIEKITTEYVNAGDPRFLQGIERCIDMRVKLLGLNKPLQIHVKHDESAARPLTSITITDVNVNNKEHVKRHAQLKKAGLNPENEVNVNYHDRAAIESQIQSKNR